MRHGEIGQAQAWYYPRDRLLMLWECYLYGPDPFGGDMYFFEMGMPNVPAMQGYDPYIEPGLGGTTGKPKMDGVESIQNDWKQNNAVVAIELEKWRRDPTGFRTQHRDHTYLDSG